MPDATSESKDFIRAIIAEDLAAGTHTRIATRFPESGLRSVSIELLGVCREGVTRSVDLGRPIYPLRVAVWTLIVVSTLVAGLTVSRLDFTGGLDNFAELVQTVEAGVQSMVFLAIAIFFLMTIENRIKRKTALRSISELRSIAHIVDMHQQTKDPEVVIYSDPPSERAKSAITQPELARYLDFSSELLSLTGKVGALYVQHFDDSVVLDAVNEVESLTTGLSRKIWQKIVLLDSAAPRGLG